MLWNTFCGDRTRGAGEEKVNYNGIFFYNLQCVKYLGEMSCRACCFLYNKFRGIWVLAWFDYSVR